MMAFAGAGKARHKSWTMTVDEPGSRGCTCKAEVDRQGHKAAGPISVQRVISSNYLVSASEK